MKACCDFIIQLKQLENNATILENRTSKYGTDIMNNVTVCVCVCGFIIAVEL